MTQREKMAKLLWLRAHRGVLSAIARQLSLSPTSVREVFWNQKTSRRIREELAAVGAPGFQAAATVTAATISNDCQGR